MKKRKLKKFVIPMIYGVCFSILVITLVLVDYSGLINNKTEKYTYVTNSIMNEEIAVISEDKILVKPFKKENVNLVKKFYDYNSSEDEKKKSIIKLNDIYLQNSGLIYSSEEQFDVVSIYDGEVVDVKKDDLFGNVVEIKHSNFISIYEGLDKVIVKKGQIINQNDEIGTSGKLSLEPVVENGLLFEIIKDGKYINPEKILEKKANEI